MASRKSFQKDEVEFIEGKQNDVEGIPHVIEIDTFRVLGLTVEDTDFYSNFPEDQRKKIFRKVRYHDSPLKARIGPANRLCSY